MLTEGRIPHNFAEAAAVDELLAAHDGAASLTRRDPGETGPLLVQIGDQVFEVDEDGEVKEAT